MARAVGSISILQWRGTWDVSARLVHQLSPFALKLRHVESLTGFQHAECLRLRDGSIRVGLR